MPCLVEDVFFCNDAQIAFTFTPTYLLCSKRLRRGVRDIRDGFLTFQVNVDVLNAFQRSQSLLNHNAIFSETSTIIYGYNWEVRSYVKEGKKDVTNSTDHPFLSIKKMIIKIWGRTAMKLKTHFSRLTSVSIPFSNVFLGMDGNTDVSTSYHHHLLFRSSDFLFFLILSTMKLWLSTIEVVLAVLPNPLRYLVTPTCCFPSLWAPKCD